jgi:sec-independent protein translocase protein TatB
MADTLILMVLALVVFGPRRLPQIGRQIGKLMFEFRKASNDFKFQMEEELRLAEEADRRKKEEEERKRAAALAAPVQPAVEASVETPAQSIEAQADIGAVEPSSEPLPATETTPAKVTGEAQETVVPLPRLQPPQTGEQVSAGRPGWAANEAPSGAEVPILPETGGGTEAGTLEDPGLPSDSEAHPAASAEASTTPKNGAGGEPETQSPIPPKEPVSQHG